MRCTVYPIPGNRGDIECVSDSNVDAASLTAWQYRICLHAAMRRVNLQISDVICLFDLAVVLLQQCHTVVNSAQRHCSPESGLFKIQKASTTRNSRPLQSSDEHARRLSQCNGTVSHEEALLAKALALSL